MADRISHSYVIEFPLSRAHVRTGRVGATDEETGEICGLGNAGLDGGMPPGTSFRLERVGGEFTGRTLATWKEKGPLGGKRTFRGVVTLDHPTLTGANIIAANDSDSARKMAQIMPAGGVPVTISGITSRSTSSDDVSPEAKAARKQRQRERAEKIKRGEHKPRTVGPNVRLGRL